MKSIEAPPQVLVWDLPTRLFHWSLVALFAISWWSAEYHYDTVHFWSGYVLMFGLLFRLMWGFVGTPTARFSSFVRGPRHIFGYLRGGWRQSHIGHSPLGAISVLALLVLLIAQVALGLFGVDEEGWDMGPLSHLVSEEASERSLELHEANFNLLLVLVGLHLAAILFYTFVLRKRLVPPMISGMAVVDPGTRPMRPASRRTALLCAVIAFAATAWIVAGAPPLGG